MKKYVSPAIEAFLLSKNDILTGSDVLINGEDLFGAKADGE